MSAVAAEKPIAAGPGEPYRGIEEFRFVDEPIFFGRQNEASALLRLVTIYRGVLLFGDSGAGKSSLINAGLMPKAVEDGFAPERIRVQPKAGEEFVIERIAPADDSQYLPSIFADHNDARRIGISAAEFRKRIDERCGRRTGGVRPILVFDQFEELVTLTEQRTSADYDTITATLLDLLRDETLPVKLLFVFREDHYAKLSKFFVRYPNLSDHSLRLEPLHVRGLRTVIEGPFQSNAVTFDHALTKPVIDNLVAEFTERSESDLLNLSEVQIASLRLWRDADPEKTLKSLGVRGILEAYFEDAIDAVPFPLRHAAIALLTRMVTSSNTRNVVLAEELIADLEEKEKISNTVAQEALDALEKTARVVRRARRNEVVIYEIVSEFLIPWIVRQKWLARTRRETAEREKRLTRAFWGVVIALGIALLAFGVIVYRTSNKVLAQELKATKAKLESTVEQHEAYVKDSEKREKELGDALMNARNALRVALARLASTNAKEHAHSIAPDRDIVFGPNANRASLSEFTLSVLRDIMRVAGVATLTISATQRSPQDQAQIMFNNLETQGVDAQRRLYKQAGQSVIDAYVEAKAAGKSADGVKAAMVAQLLKVDPSQVSRHVVDPRVLNIVDVVPSSVAHQAEFEEAARKDGRVAKVLMPPNDLAFHLEIPQPK